MLIQLVRAYCWLSFNHSSILSASDFLFGGQSINTDIIGLRYALGVEVASLSPKLFFTKKKRKRKNVAAQNTHWEDQNKGQSIEEPPLIQRTIWSFELGIQIQFGE